VFATLADRNLLTPAGAIETRGPQVQVRIDGAIDSLEAIRATPVAADGRVLGLGGIADVRRGYEDPPTYLIRHQGEPALELGVVMRERYNGLQLGRDLKAATHAIAAETFEQFWLRYLRAHTNPVCRGFHYAATSWSMACLVALGLTGQPIWLLFGAIGSYGLAWTGHFFVEGNTPLAFSRPLYSLAADYRMFFLAISGRLGPELSRSAKASAMD
jgi:hypothetical protein